jgi:hypothetical protein
VIWLVAALVLVVAGYATVRLLEAISSRGGMAGGDAATRAAQVVAQSQAFRGDRNPTPWDGEDRLKALPGDSGAGLI